MKCSLINNQQKYILSSFAWFIMLLIYSSCERGESKTTDETIEESWEIIFNGQNLDGWTPKFRVVDGVIQVNYDGYDSFDERYGHLFYKNPYGSFHLKFDYRFTEQWMEDAPSYTYRNSGVMFHSQAPETILKEQDWPISVEYQMLADAGDGKPRPTGNMCSPGTEVYFEGEMDPRHCIDSSSPTFPWDEWVHAELIVYSDSLVIHKVNGEEVLQYTKPQIGGGVAKRFDPSYKVDGKLLKEGYIGLQAEGQGVEFKNIKIKAFQ